MKKIFKFLTATFLIMMTNFVSTVLVSCKDKPTEQVDPAKQDVLFADFEAWAPDLQMARHMNGFGKLSLNEDKTYVSHGEKSVRLDPLGWYGAGSLPLVFFPTQSTSFHYNYADFSYTDYISFDIYNANEEEKTIEVGLVGSITSITDINRVGKKNYTLKKGWNKLVYYVEAAIISVNADITNVQGLYFCFENAKSLNVTDSTPKYYLDNINFIKKEEKSETTFDIELDAYEIADFERNYQKYMVSNDNPSTMEIVTASQYGITAPSGTKVLRVVLNGVNTNFWKNFKIAETLVRATELYNMSAEDANYAYICFETYNNTDKVYNLPLDYTMGGNGKTFLSTSNYCHPGEWTSYEYKVSDILKIQPNFLKNPGQLLLAYKDDCMENREFFFDNFRIEIRK